MNVAQIIQKLQQSSEIASYAKALGAHPAASFLVLPDDDSTIVYANSAFYKLIGCSESELQYRYANRLAALTIGDGLNLTPLSDSTVKVVEHKIKKPDMEEIWLHTEAIAFPVSGIVLYSCTCQNVTEQKLTEESLFDYRLTTWRVSKLTGNEVFLYDIGTQKALLYSSCTILSQICDEDQIVYQTFQDAMLSKKIVAGRYEKIFEEAFLSVRRGNPSVCELQMRNMFGRDIWVRMTLEPKEFTQTDGWRAIGILQDITEQKEAALTYLNETQYYQAMLSEKDAFAPSGCKREQSTQGGRAVVYV